MQLTEVTDKETRSLFHLVPHLIYKNDKNWACPLEGMVEDVFNPVKNKTFRHGKAIRWILFDGKGQLIGRIAAFINENLAHTYEQPTGGCGFFECTDNQEAANLLFQAAANWNKANEMEAMDGPINFGENYINWGLLVDGFMPQGYGMPYNPPYYEKLFRGFGFEVYFEQYCYHLDYTKPFPERFWKIAEWIAKKPQYKFRHINFKETREFVQDFCTIYDAAWAFHEHYKPIDPDDILDFVNNSKAILDPRNDLVCLPRRKTHCTFCNDSGHQPDFAKTERETEFVRNHKISVLQKHKNHDTDPNIYHGYRPRLPAFGS